jgi:hypothetical protein
LPQLSLKKKNLRRSHNIIFNISMKSFYKMGVTVEAKRFNLESDVLWRCAGKEEYRKKNYTIEKFAARFTRVVVVQLRLVGSTFNQNC